MKSLRSMLPDLKKAFGSSAIQLALTLLATPIMTRLYAPDAYGTFGVLNTAANAIAGVGLLSLPTAYIASKSVTKRLQLLKAMWQLSLLCFAMSSIGAMGYVAWSYHHPAPAFTWDVVVLMPCLILAYNIKDVARVLAVQQRAFNAVSLARLVDPAVSRGGAIGMGAAFSGQPAYILIAMIAGLLAAGQAILYMLRRRVKLLYCAMRHTSGAIAASWRHYSDFMVFQTLGSRMHVLQPLVVQSCILAVISKEMAGYYILAGSILNMPTMLVAVAANSIIYGYLVDAERVRPELLCNRVLRITAACLAVACLVYLPVLFFGETLFALAFGEQWRQAGFIASVLLFSEVFRFACANVDSSFSITRRMRLKMVLEVVSTAIVLLGFFAALRYTDFITTLYVLTASVSLRYVLLLLGSVYVAYQHGLVCKKNAVLKHTKEEH